MPTNRKKKVTFPPMEVSEFTDSQINRMIKSNTWRIFELNGIDFIVPSRNAPIVTIKGQLIVGGKVDAMPRLTYSHETKGPNKGKRLWLMAWPYSTMTIQDFDEYNDAPKSLSGIPDVIGYVWTDSGLHIYQRGKHELMDGADPTYEFVSKYHRGWYGDRIRSKDELTVRTLVTNDEESAIAWAKAGGHVRMVKDIVRSFGVSTLHKGW